MTCEERDSDLLLLAHRECNIGTALRTWAHLATCADCRARYQQFVVVSGWLRAGAREATEALAPSGNTTTSAAIAPTHEAFPLRLIWASVFVCLVLMLVAAMTFLPRIVVGSQIAHPSRPCRPDLQNDRCSE